MTVDLDLDLGEAVKDGVADEEIRRALIVRERPAVHAHPATPGRDCPACPCPRGKHDGFGCGCGCALPRSLITRTLGVLL